MQSTGQTMDSRTRVRMALDHKEPDRVPFDLGGTGLSSIHVTAYRNLRNALGLPAIEARVSHIGEQLAYVDDDVRERLEADVYPVMPGTPTGFAYTLHQDGAYESYVDEWGIGWRKPLDGGFYYDMFLHPLAAADSLSELRHYPMPDPLDDARFAPLREQAERARALGKAVALAGPSAGILEIYSWLRGFEQFYVDMAIHRDWVAMMLDRLVEFKSAYWERALRELGDLVDIVIEADDLGAQKSLLFSPRAYRDVVKPRHRRLFHFIKDQAPVKVFYHTCGAVRPLIPDLIDAGIDILNPIQISAAGMDLIELKREYGRDLVFWGGGVETQQILGSGTPDEVRADVERNIAALAPGGGFVFATVHDIQANVPPENILAMWETWCTHGVYPQC